ncbi:helix-turn-helix transcriptional regulator [Hymenobacter sp. RP-2-7]|uniref:Helix-turn-helix transcriptional regulator n=1 Tax=Hymenobacter polaris TaxID=2682546 RepID=A0A7Y0FMN4_9BACT|nr:helix-turn-helix transcriptional regulator [Hymenobacter polaris]NML65609.1 helix-turn-helix transcriptional regulator [Hymenobacter polaris]
MLFTYMFRAAVLLPLLGPAVAVAVLLATSRRRRPLLPGLLLALLLLLPVFLLAQCLLSVASWCLTPLAEAAATPFYAPWYAELLLAPVCYLYLRVLTSPALRRARAWRRLLPGLGQVGLFAGVAVLDLGYRHGVAAARFGPPSAAAELLRHVLVPLALGCYALLLLYGLHTLEAQRRYRAAAPFGVARPAGPPRTLLLVLLLGFGLGLSFVALDAWFGPFPYSEIWYALGVRAGLVFGLAVVGLQASYAGPRPPQLASAWLPASRALGLPPWGRPPAANLTTGSPPPAAPVGSPPPELPTELLPVRTRLLACMEAERPWLEPELTLAELALRLQAHPALLSKVINQGCRQNFNDFVNSYRVAEARRKLADPRYSHYSLVGVALESGFNSKSTFNRVFKKLTGQAPGELTRPKL